MQRPLRSRIAGKRSVSPAKYTLVVYLHSMGNGPDEVTKYQAGREPLVAYLILSRFPANFNFVFLAAFGIGLLAIASLIFISDVVVRAGAKRAQLIESFARFSTPGPARGFPR